MKNLVRLSKQYFSKGDDTIYALSTGTNTAISIIRISGSQAHRALSLLKPSLREKSDMSRHKLLGANKIEARLAALKKIYKKGGQVIDEGLVLYFPCESSYNNEELFEFHVHGSKAVVAAIFQELKGLGMRMAERGEFTKRAVLNGKLNLYQAEAINDLIRSESEFGRQIAINHLLGKNADYLATLRNKLVRSLAKNQAYIDFEEEESDVHADLFSQTKQQVREVICQIEKMQRNYKNLQITKDGINITIVGRPNVGKSTLINGLSQKQVSIVSSQPGTTRDVVQTSIQNNGYLITLFDTAGIRQTSDQIESEGIKRAKQKIQNSHYTILMVDLAQEEIRLEEQQIVIDLMRRGFDQEDIGHKTIIVVNKSDEIEHGMKKKSLSIVTESGRKKVDMLISARDEKDVEELLGMIGKKMEEDFGLYKDNADEVYFTRQRYFEKLEKCNQLLNAYITEDRPDISCEYLRRAIAEIGDMFGRVDAEDVLDVLFSEFCIGK